MTVAELIAKLSQAPQDALVVTSAYEYGYTLVESVMVVDMYRAREKPEYWEGAYEWAKYDREDAERAGIVKTVVLPR
jgi:hypothetical protein